jgi:hypothetical protein
MLTGLIVACIAANPCEPEQALAAKPVAAAEQAVEQAVDYLAREVPRWRPENKCASCHNNGDAARALFLASSVGHELKPAVLSNTLEWLTNPDRWDDNGGEGPFNDRQLADIQFGYALASAIEGGLVKERELLRAAAQRIAGHQRADGSWQVVPEGTLGAPATYGTVLATALSQATLTDARSAEFDSAVARATDWLDRQRPKTVLDAAALLAAPRYRVEDEQRTACLEVLKAGAGSMGGWGPYVISPPEPFDTALALIGLARLKASARETGRDWTEFDDQIRRGREYLVTSQLSDGSWPETTRPPGAESYAQRMSTTGWATMALLLTAPPPK